MKILSTLFFTVIASAAPRDVSTALRNLLFSRVLICSFSLVAREWLSSFRRARRWSSKGIIIVRVQAALRVIECMGQTRTERRKMKYWVPLGEMFGVKDDESRAAVWTMSTVSPV